MGFCRLISIYHYSKIATKNKTPCKPFIYQGLQGVCSSFCF
nr:MAG TPA: hypothetical protein [Caudoviricetes sp.]